MCTALHSLDHATRQPARTSTLDAWGDGSGSCISGMSMASLGAGKDPITGAAGGILCEMSTPPRLPRPRAGPRGAMGMGLDRCAAMLQSDTRTLALGPRHQPRAGLAWLSWTKRLGAELQVASLTVANAQTALLHVQTTAEHSQGAWIDMEGVSFV